MIEEAAANYFTAEDARADLLLQVTEQEAVMAANVERLRELGESTTRVASLLQIDSKELRRLLTTSISSPTSPSNSVDDGGPVTTAPAENNASTAEPAA